MSSAKIFFAEFITVVAGAIFLVMTAAFITIPYNLAGHPGEARQDVTRK